MELKKSKKANLESKRTLFLEIGLALALLLVLLGFEWSRAEINKTSLGELPDITGEEEIVPITRQELQQPKTPPKPQPIVLELNIVDNDVELDDEFELEDFEADQDDMIEIIEMEPEEETEDEIFVIVEDMPKFQGGGLNDFRLYIQANLKYPRIAEENSISGTVHVSFVVDKKGEISEITILRGVDPSLDNEVIRGLKAAPKWTPGMQRMKPVFVRMSMPVKFTLL